MWSHWDSPWILFGDFRVELWNLGQKSWNVGKHGTVGTWGDKGKVVQMGFSLMKGG